MYKRVFLVIAIIVLILPIMASTQSEESPSITVEAVLCTSVEERMPVGTNDHFPSDVGQVCLWSKVLGCMDTTTIKHIWYYQGDEIAAFKLPVRSSSWRTFSYKTIPSGWSGDWAVKVVDAGGNVLKAIPFKIGETAAAESKPAEDSTGSGQ